MGYAQHHQSDGLTVFVERVMNWRMVVIWGGFALVSIAVQVGAILLLAECF